jgi:hypothetical protein
MIGIDGLSKLSVEDGCTDIPARYRLHYLSLLELGKGVK